MGADGSRQETCLLGARFTWCLSRQGAIRAILIDMELVVVGGIFLVFFLVMAGAMLYKAVKIGNKLHRKMNRWLDEE